MDFGDILDDWEHRSAKPGGLKGADEAERRLREAEAARQKSLAAAEARRRAEKAKTRQSFESWLDEHGVEDKDARGRAEAPPSSAADRRAREAETKRLRDKKPEARLDLHGMTAAEAETALEGFLVEAAVRGLEKVLVVTGKGMHSKGEPVLGKVARRVLEASPHAGRFGQAEPADGGAGALWVLVRRGVISRGR